MAKSAQRHEERIRSAKVTIETLSKVSIGCSVATILSAWAFLIGLELAVVPAGLFGISATVTKLAERHVEEEIYHLECKLAIIVTNEEVLDPKPAKNGLMPMTGKLTPKVLRHNLKRVKSQGPTAKALCEQAEKHLATVKDYYKKLDQLAALSDDQKTVILIRRNFDAVSAEIYAVVANVIKLCILADSDPDAYDAACTELAKIEELLDQKQFGQSLYELAAEQTPVLTAPSAAEEIMRLKELSDSLLNGARDGRMVTIPEIFSD